jgi:endonuclease/exonuclease/phosphatase family metal-dependent hydrolase
MMRPIPIALLVTAAITASCANASPEWIEVAVMTFNVRWDGLDDGKKAWPNRRPVAIEMISKYAPDVIGLQEPSLAQTRDLEEGLEHYTSYRSNHERDQHITFLYRSDRFDLAEGGSFWLVEESNLSGGTRRCVWVRLIDRRSHSHFYVFNNHFDHRSSRSREQSALSLARGILNREHDDPFIVLGDFNERESGPAVQYLMGTQIADAETAPLDGSRIALVDAYRAKHPERLESASEQSSTGKAEYGRIDFIFVRRQDEVLAARIIRFNRDGLYPSDHFPVIASVRLLAN